MKKVLIISAALALVCSSANAQSFLEKLGQRALDRAVSKTESAADRVVDKAFDAVEGLFTKKDKDEEPANNKQAAAAGSWTCPECGKTGNTGNFCDDCGARKPGTGSSTSAQSGWTCPECGKTGNTGNFCADCGAKKPGTGGAAVSSAPAPELQDLAMSSEINDFVPGSVVIFEDNLAGERIGEFPSKWDVVDGSIGVNRLGDRTVIKFDNEGGTIIPLMEKDMYNYLPEEFTLEFDIYISKFQQFDFKMMRFELGLMNRDRNVNQWNSYCAQVQIEYFPFDQNDHLSATISYNCQKPVEGSVRGKCEDNNTYLKAAAFNHIAVAFNKRSFKMYVNGNRVINVPNMTAPKYFQLNYWDSNKYPYCVISNVRLAKNGAELYERNASDLSAVEKAMQASGKFVTNNILFETGKATLKPESMADIQAVADYMKKNPSVRFEVQGHCDNQGSDSVNDPLSQKRAEAIVAELVKLGVDEWNLRPVGKGSHEPVADNSTEEGRAKNRRVEFIKK
ncbi:MAG: OmpA family protein [Bacteroidia bacterium]|nr:OmpA family protein [Bacteroidia bacterium]